MEINVIAKTNAKKPGIIKIDEENFQVNVSASPKQGKANSAIIKILSNYFDIPKSNITIIKGDRSKNKVVEISPA